MEAKDTMLKSSIGSDGKVHFPTREEQSEISFKAGQESERVKFRTHIDHLEYINRAITQKLMAEVRFEVAEWVNAQNFSQDEIAHENGRQAGIKLVVDWMEQSSVSMNYETRLIWQTKLKEWGIV